MAPRVTRIYSWNVNGLRACAEKGFLDWLARAKADVVGLQETRATADQLPADLRKPSRVHTYFASAEKLGYSGVALYARRPFDTVSTTLGVPEFDAEGRVQIATLGALTIANVYFPNGNGKDRDNSRVPFKMAFTKRLFETLDPQRRNGGRVIVMGDFNTAPEAIDLARPKSNLKTSGFLPEEREQLRQLLSAGWVDSFRHHHTDGDHYTWWSQRFGVRERNVGWRIDLAFVSEGVVPFLRNATIHPEVMGSDHCPISLDLHPAVLD
jgi:exodeoxyribonuclease-3